MLSKNSIAKIYKYYFTTPRYNEEVVRATCEFFDRPDLKRGDSLEMDDKSLGLFNEWFLYDFKLVNGKTPLANFVAKNPLKVSKKDMAFYRAILKSNEYGLFEVLHIDLNTGLMLKNLQTEKENYVYERSLTSQVEIGSVFFGRIGLVNDHYELIGADSFSMIATGDEIKRYFHGIKIKLTPKIACDIWKRQ